MVQEQAAILEPQTLLDEFKKNGVTHVVTIPDSETNYLYELMRARGMFGPEVASPGIRPCNAGIVRSGTTSTLST